MHTFATFTHPDLFARFQRPQIATSLSPKEPYIKGLLIFKIGCVLQCVLQYVLQYVLPCVLH